MADYDKENIPESTVKKVNVILNNPEITVDNIILIRSRVLLVPKN